MPIVKNEYVVSETSVMNVNNPVATLKEKIHDSPYGFLNRPFGISNGISFSTG